MTESFMSDATAAQEDITSRSALPHPSAWLLVSLGVAALGGVIAAYASIDVDLYWHRVLGQVWLGQHTFELSPDPIAYAPGVRDWFPTAWLSEACYAALVGTFGYGGIVALRLVLVVAFYGLLARFLHHRFSAPVAALLLAVVGLPAATSMQDRPQTFSLVLVVALLPAVDRWRVSGRLPHPAAAIALTWAWANVHGLWLLVPSFLVIAFLASLLVRAPRWAALATAAGAVAVAAVTPVGPRLLLSPFLVRGSTGELLEWRPTTLVNPTGWGLAACLLLVLVGWATSARSASHREVVFTVTLLAFGFYAFRNAVFASLLLLPVAGAYLDRLCSRFTPSATTPRALLVATGLAALVGLGFLLSRQPLPPDTLPSTIASDLAARPGPVRVMPPYNVSGYLREFGGQGVRVAIDGRSDRYGNARIATYSEAMAGRPGWRTEIALLRPDVIVSERESALTQLLPLDGWHRRTTDHDYVLWDAP